MKIYLSAQIPIIGGINMFKDKDLSLILLLFAILFMSSLSAIHESVQKPTFENPVNEELKVNSNPD